MMISPWKEVKLETAASKCQTGSSSPAVAVTASPTIGTRVKRIRSALFGTISSLAMSLKKSATGWRMPKRPVWVGPIRFCRRA